eukprot:m.153896 g.153896  ORF g.153896 m.153896 type:complete len:195 (-) comp11712_c0_seq22:711-1295(-)
MTPRGTGWHLTSARQSTARHCIFYSITSFYSRQRSAEQSSTEVDPVQSTADQGHWLQWVSVSPEASDGHLTRRQSIDPSIRFWCCRQTVSTTTCSGAVYHLNASCMSGVLPKQATVVLMAVEVNLKERQRHHHNHPTDIKLDADVMAVVRKGKQAVQATVGSLEQQHFFRRPVVMAHVYFTALPVLLLTPQVTP